jgi:hypothetical protein
MTNEEFAAANPTLRKACEMAGIPVTSRQASKWQRKTGSAYVYRNAALMELKKEQFSSGQYEKV